MNDTQSLSWKNVVLVVVILFGVGLLFKPQYASSMYEEVTFVINPTAERGLLYGSKHFDSGQAENYDLVRAERFLRKAYEADPEYPFVRHQLARIEFLKGNFIAALRHIEAEIKTNPNPSSYYVRGLVKGYLEDYAGAAKDYETYLHTDPRNWAGINDYAWVLLKADRPRDALVAVDWGLLYWSDNAWLLNNKATAHFELGQFTLAEEAVQHAALAVQSVTPSQWSQAYPGNDPLIARQGVEALKVAISENMHIIEAALENEDKPVQ